MNAIETYADAHPVAFAILAFPVVCTFCLGGFLFFCGIFGVELSWHR